jgi:hypothetical protein
MQQLGLHDFDGGINLLTESGYIAGWTNNPNEPFLSGRSAWIAHVGGGIHQVGIVDEFPYGDIFNDGESWVIDLNELGISLGESRQFPTDFDWQNTGTGTWIADALGETTIVGLYDSEHTNKIEHRSSPASSSTATTRATAPSA